MRSLILVYILLWILKCDPYVSPRILHHLYSSTNRVNKFLHQCPVQDSAFGAVIPISMSVNVTTWEKS